MPKRIAEYLLLSEPERYTGIYDLYRQFSILSDAHLQCFELQVIHSDARQPQSWPTVVLIWRRLCGTALGGMNPALKATSKTR